MKTFQNLLFNDNVLCIVIEFDTRRVLDPDKGSLFAVIAETVPLPSTARSSGTNRHAWIGLAVPSRPIFASTTAG